MNRWVAWLDWKHKKFYKLLVDSTGRQVEDTPPVEVGYTDYCKLPKMRGDLRNSITREEME